MSSVRQRRDRGAWGLGYRHTQSHRATCPGRGRLRETVLHAGATDTRRSPVRPPAPPVHPPQTTPAASLAATPTAAVLSSRRRRCGCGRSRPQPRPAAAPARPASPATPALRCDSPPAPTATSPPSSSAQGICQSMSPGAARRGSSGGLRRTYPRTWRQCHGGRANTVTEQQTLRQRSLKQRVGRCRRAAPRNMHYCIAHTARLWCACTHCCT